MEMELCKNTSQSAIELSNNRSMKMECNIFINAYSKQKELQIVFTEH